MPNYQTGKEHQENRGYMAAGNKNRRAIKVYADWETLPKAELMGTLYSERIRGKEIFSFEYSKDWLQSGNAQNLDPDLQFYEGGQYLSAEKSNFGLFLDSSPDRWGRLLMKSYQDFFCSKINYKSLFSMIPNLHITYAKNQDIIKKF